MSDLDDYRESIDKAKSRLEMYEESLSKNKKELHEARLKAEDCEEAQKILQAVAQTVQQMVHDRIAGVVTRFIKTVFEEDACEFKIIFERKRGRTEARPVFMQEGQEIIPKDEGSGGMIDVAVIALRLACIKLSKPQKRLLLVMDEPFKWLSPRRRRDRAKDMLMALSKEMGVQIIMSTNIEGMELGKVIRLDEED